MHNLVITGEVSALADLMNHAGLEINRFSPTDASQTRIAESCRQRKCGRSDDAAGDQFWIRVGVLTAGVSFIEVPPRKP
jgi:hypothetical protein